MKILIDSHICISVPLSEIYAEHLTYCKPDGCVNIELIVAYLC